MGNQEGLGDAATPSPSLWGNSLAVYPTSSPVLEQRWAGRLTHRLSQIERSRYPHALTGFAPGASMAARSMGRQATKERL